MKTDSSNKVKLFYITYPNIGRTKARTRTK